MWQNTFVHRTEPQARNTIISDYSLPPWACSLIKFTLFVSIISSCCCFFFFQHPSGSLRHVSVHRTVTTTSATASRASDEAAAHTPSSWTAKCWVEAESRDGRAGRGASSGRGISRASGKGDVSWTGMKRGSRRQEQGTGPEIVRRRWDTTAVKTPPRLCTRNTKSAARTWSRAKTQRTLMTLYPRRGERTKDIHRAPQVWICTRLSFCLLWEPGTYRQGSGGNRRQILEDRTPAAWEVQEMSWRDFWTWCHLEPGERPE